jgi:hypothetical protein
MRRRWKILIWTSALVALIAVFGVSTHLQAKRTVQRYRNQLAAQGEKLTVGDLTPRSPTNGFNGAADLVAACNMCSSTAYDYLPLARKYVVPGHARVAWQQAILGSAKGTNVWPWLARYFETNRQAMTDTRAALENPVLYFNLDYSQGANISIFHLMQLRSASQRLSAAALSELHEGRPAAAWENLRALNALARNYPGEPLIMSQLVRAAICQLTLAATWEALQSDQWDDTQLAELQAAWQSLRSLPGLEGAMAMERAVQETALASARNSRFAFNTQIGATASGNNSGAFSDLVDMGKELIEDPAEGWQSLLNRYPRYWAWRWWWSYEEELYNMQVWQAGIEAARRANAGESLTAADRQLRSAIAEIDKQHPNAKTRFLLGGANGGRGEGFFLRVAVIEAQREMVVAAIGLKRYHTRHRKYPEALAKLVPGFLPRLPSDPMDGKPLRYRLNSDGSYLLYSVGENGEDNKGDPVRASSSPGAAGQTARANYWWAGRDAVWPLPASAAEIAAEESKGNPPKAP